jgi:hypothetical protein
MGQLGFFDLNRRYESLTEKNDPLVAIAARRLGLNPTPPRVSAFKDAIKRSVYGPSIEPFFNPRARRAGRSSRCNIPRARSDRPAKASPVQRRQHRRTNRLPRHFQGIG